MARGSPGHAAARTTGQTISADALLAIIAGHDPTGLIELRCLNPTTGLVTGREWFAPSDRAAAIRYIRARAKTADVYVGAAPRTRREGGKAAIKRAWCCWVDLDSPEAVERLRAFTPRPALVVRSGTGENVHAYWPVTAPLSPAWVERANRRLAYRLGADMRATDTARILRPPGSLNWKTTPPEKVRAVRFYQDSINPAKAVNVAALVGDIPDPPTHRPMPRPRPVSVPVTDDLTAVPVHHYVRVLSGREPDGRNMLCCTVHKAGGETNPSMKVFPETNTWYCWGCSRGGDVYELGAHLWGLDRRSQFRELRSRLMSEMGIT